MSRAEYKSLQGAIKAPQRLYIGIFRYHLFMAHPSEQLKEKLNDL